MFAELVFSFVYVIIALKSSQNSESSINELVVSYGTDIAVDTEESGTQLLFTKSISKGQIIQNKLWLILKSHIQVVLCN